jgi:hypothetical protein
MAVILTQNVTPGLAMVLCKLGPPHLTYDWLDIMRIASASSSKIEDGDLEREDSTREKNAVSMTVHLTDEAYNQLNGLIGSQVASRSDLFKLIRNQKP